MAFNDIILVQETTPGFIGRTITPSASGLLGFNSLGQPVAYTSEQVSQSFSGYSGYSGVSGYSGISGFSGISGYSGNSTSGFSGISGYSGPGADQTLNTNSSVVFTSVSATNLRSAADVIFAGNIIDTSALTVSATGTITLTAGTGTVAVPGTLSATNVRTASAVYDFIGDIRILPQTSQSAAYTLVFADAGKHIFHPSADTTARTFTIPGNATVPWPIGTAVTFVNQNGAGTVTLSAIDTLRLAPTGLTGTRTLTANGIATALKVTATEWIVSGPGVT